jgi:hypothetical protein
MALLSSEPFTLQQLTAHQNYFLQKHPKNRMSIPPMAHLQQNKRVTVGIVTPANSLQ